MPGRFLESLLYGTTTLNGSVYALVIAVLGSVAVIACYLPARRAARLDPAVTLRAE